MAVRTSLPAWTWVQLRGAIDAEDFFRGVIDLWRDEPDCPRSVSLCGHAVDFFRERWGARRLRRLLARRGAVAMLYDPTLPEAKAETPFYCLEERIVDAFDPDTLFDLLRDLGRRLNAPAEIVIGGVLALMVDDIVVRDTADVDIVDELPAAVRAQPGLVDQLAQRYALRLTHFQSHYLPDGWRSRVHSLGKYDQLVAFRVDPLDVLLGKLFSTRNKDFVDLRTAWKKIDLDAFRRRLQTSARPYYKVERALAAGKHNWYVLTGEEQLPTPEFSLT